MLNVSVTLKKTLKRNNDYTMIPTKGDTNISTKLEGNKATESLLRLLGSNWNDIRSTLKFYS